MAGDAEGATKVVRGARHRRGHPTTRPQPAARKVAESQLVKCSWYGEDPYWGRVVSELGSAGVAFDPDRVSRRLRRHRRCAGDGVAVDHDAAARGRAHGRRARSTSPPTSASATARASMLTNDLTHALHRREHGDVVSGHDAAATRPRSWSRPCPYIRRFWGKVVVVKYGGNAIGDDAALASRSPRTSCSCARSACGPSSSTAAVRRSAT